jgi:Osmosensitive K+ channel His kinase sensor domain
MSFWAIVILVTALSMTWAAVIGARSRSARLHARELAMMDELAHANLAGERHARRWQDVGELLANGIDVYTTLNVANIESLGEIVSGSPACTGPSRCRTRSRGPARSHWSTLRCIQPRRPLLPHLRREAPCCIPGSAGRNSKGGSWV